MPRERNMCWWSVDPGFNVGIASWIGTRKRSQLWSTTILRPFSSTPTEPFELRVKDIVNKVHHLLKNPRFGFPYYVIMEGPNYFESLKGQTAARRGDLMKLMMTSGAIMGAFMSIGVPFEVVPVNVWLGQLDKPKVVKRIKKRLTPEEQKQLSEWSHEMYAVGVGLWRQGRF